MIALIPKDCVEYRCGRRLPVVYVSISSKCLINGADLNFHKAEMSA